jgi:hypothetical protein
VRLDEAAERARDVQALKAEARDFEARNGKNLYSDFILKYDRRPEPDHAATLGRLINIQVKASDGSLQPKLTKAERASRKMFRAEQKAKAHRASQVFALVGAIRDLSEISEDPANILSGLSPSFDRPIIGEKLDAAVEFLERFAREWRRWQETNGEKSETI